mmetsp:Transcript_8731/g.28590  ORF Transcript_8731/g.28590 Transcript_8731/m.28590 type:complete len:274 (-) Transcript_8731:699-1520(-)
MIQRILMHVLCVSATSLAHALVGTRVLHRAVSRHAARRLVPIPRHAEAHQLLGRGRLARVGSVGVGDAPPELLAVVDRRAEDLGGLQLGVGARVEGGRKWKEAHVRPCEGQRRRALLARRTQAPVGAPLLEVHLARLLPEGGHPLVAAVRHHARLHLPPTQVPRRVVRLPRRVEDAAALEGGGEVVVVQQGEELRDGGRADECVSVEEDRLRKRRLVVRAQLLDARVVVDRLAAAHRECGDVVHAQPRAEPNGGNAAVAQHSYRPARRRQRAD